MANAILRLKQLESLKFEFGPLAAEQKSVCLNALKSTELSNVHQIRRLHEILCFMQAWPDDEAILSTVDAMLARFEHRPDVKRHADELTNTGIAGTAINFRFYAVTAQWLADRWPKQIHVDWEDFDNAEMFEPFLNLMASYSELPGLESIVMKLPEWINRLKGLHETDAYFVMRRMAVLISNEFLHEHVYDTIDIPLILTPGHGVPSRTLAKYDKWPTEYQRTPLVRRTARCGRRNPPPAQAGRAGQPRRRAFGWSTSPAAP